MRLAILLPRCCGCVLELKKIYGSSKLVSSGPWGRKAGPESLCGIISSGGSSGSSSGSSGSSGNSGSQWLRNLEEEKRKETTQERKRKRIKAAAKLVSTMPARCPQLDARFTSAVVCLIHLSSHFLPREPPRSALQAALAWAIVLGSMQRGRKPGQIPEL